MSAHTDVVPYRWTNLDRLAASPWVPLPNLTLTPYRIPIHAVSHASQRDKGELVHISLGLSNDPATVARFFREGYEWIDLPAAVDPGASLGSLFQALFAHDPRKFAHLDPVLNTVATLTSTASNVTGMSPTSMLDPNLIPFADLALLHFEHWGNTNLRAAVINQLSLGFKIPLLQLDPLTTLMTGLAPLAIPTRAEGASLEKVLARKALKGVPIRAVPTTQADSSDKQVTVVTLPPPRIELDRFCRQTLKPLRYTEWKPRASKVRFRITLPVPASEVRIEIRKGGSVYYAETHELGQFVLPGAHVWTWDGYDQRGVFDTTMLKQNDLSARLTVVDLYGRTSVATTELGTGPDVIRWVDAKILPAQRRIEVTVACRFTSPSEVEIASFRLPLGPLADALSTVVGAASALAAPGGLPGASALGMLPGASSLPGAAAIPYPGLPGTSAIPELLNTKKLGVAVNIPPVLDLDEERFARLQSAVMQGIARHWSRSVTIDGERWTLAVNCQLRNGADAQWTILSRSMPELLDDPGLDFGHRSFNLATFMEGLPIVNIFDNSDDENGDNVTDVDARRAETGAHELGHSVLRESGTFYHSLTHKGSSTIGQTPSPSAPSWRSYLAGEEIDLMHYRAHDGAGRPRDWQSRILACEEDALGLVAMAVVSFG